MPCFRGLELSIAAASDRNVFPEFPHPDGSSAKFAGLNSTHSSAKFLSPRRLVQTRGDAADVGQTCGQTCPKISVYIPSTPGASFFVRYKISTPPAEHKYLFFKTYINGRPIVSWGINLHKTTSGATHQALFQPSELYQYNDNGVIFSQPGIESRGFRFVDNGSGAASVAEDGGLIEVQVFRARARSRRAPQPELCLDREKYGIALISNGLLEKPHMAYYYDYHLFDARDAPYCSFRFHYRSWESLRFLQLAPSGSPGCLELVSPVSPVTSPERGPSRHAARPLPPLPLFSTPPTLPRTGKAGKTEKQEQGCKYVQEESPVEEGCNMHKASTGQARKPEVEDVFAPLPCARKKAVGFLLFPFTDNLCKRQVPCMVDSRESGSPTPMRQTHQEQKDMDSCEFF